MKIINLIKIFLFGSLILTGSRLYAQYHLKRNIVSLNGTWQIAEGNMSAIPNEFDHEVQVPGLVSLAKPAFKDVGPKVKDRNSIEQSDPLREAFWYRRTFNIKSPIPEVAILKIAKAKYGTKVFLNGKNLGEHLPCFTPGYFNVKNILKTGENELIIRVGSSRDAIPPSIPDGFDFEKERYIPGIYDNVKLILSGVPHIVRVQTVPDITNKELQVQLALQATEAKDANISFVIKEANSEVVAAKLMKTVKLSEPDKEEEINVRIPIKDLHLWSPEDPFLYQLIIKTDGDESTTIFGMREFHFDPLTNRPMLNGKPYFMRGSNITLYRFFEDSSCKALPWDTTWVRNLFKSFKQFHWNSLRFCIGLPPEEWYHIADEEGFLIQDEFPIWYGGRGWSKWPPELTTDELTKEFTSWMQENWNHPSVVIWDASNETASNNGKTDEPGKAIWRVRNLDLSNRPWDNSYSSHRAPGDVFESHPYHFSRPGFKLKDLKEANIIPQGNQIKNNGTFPVIINEYGWLWLNRDGSPTTLTKKIYERLLGPHPTTKQRWNLYASYMAAETEFWRCHRKAAGVLIFTALGYSRKDGQTSDFFTDPAKLEYNNAILKYLPDAFSPVGIMLDEWGDTIETNALHDFKIVTINDLEPEWRGEISLQIIKDGEIVIQKSSDCKIPSYGKAAFTISCKTPGAPGLYEVVALLKNKDQKPVKSIRQINFK